MTCLAHHHVEICGDCHHLASEHRSKGYGEAFVCGCQCGMTDVTPTYPFCNVSGLRCNDATQRDFDKYRPSSDIGGTDE